MIDGGRHNQSLAHVRGRSRDKEVLEAMFVEGFYVASGQLTLAIGTTAPATPILLASRMTLVGTMVSMRRTAE